MCVAKVVEKLLDEGKGVYMLVGPELCTLQAKQATITDHKTACNYIT